MARAFDEGEAGLATVPQAQKPTTTSHNDPTSTTNSQNVGVLGIPKDRLISLAWATPFLVFLIFPITAAIRAGWSHPVVPYLLTSTAALAITYIAAWIINPPAPLSPRITKRFVVSFVLVVAAQVGMESLVLLPEAKQITGGAYMVCYIASIAALLSPKPLLIPSTGFSVVLVALEILLVPGEQHFAILTVCMTLVICLLARNGVERDRRESVRHQHELLLEREVERSRISADLHDILGQTLTGITVKADLAGRLLDAGRSDEARTQIDELTELSRSALADVRTVVAQNRTLLPETEVEQSRGLVQAIGARFEVVYEGEPAPGAPSTLVAHTIREGVTNALHHAAPSVVTVTLRSDGVKVVNDGLLDNDRVGSGLAGLRERVGEAGTVTAGVEDGRWVLDLALKVEA
ncbi:sensor histidine kinase [Schaalia vaccimaxillae]|uniref:sensor histidine kinase n=1 Tax=Schaalia vaccimaxillae TaxID=183916 RepID=UPI0003B70433|nr:histidine kinase [Schaalia vaccimaxillae]